MPSHNILYLFRNNEQVPCSRIDTKSRGPHCPPANGRTSFYFANAKELPLGALVTRGCETP